ncbi:MAG TPA: rhodanese-like domain-containing protein, partial [Vicingus sp.]|nr:rhodanese-like domain-containing protein [Vicingus sp.]
DTLFLGDVGRPDLAIKSDVTEKDLAGMLFDSLRNKIMPLADEIIVYPGHGAGSACGKNMSKETVGTLGEQKQTNYALRANMTKEEFIAEVLHGILPPPQYFAKNAMMNKHGYKSMDNVMAAGLNPMSIEQFEKEMNNAIIIDTRTQHDFKEGFIPSSIFIGLNGQFAVWVGALIPDLNQKILLVTDEGKEEESVLRLARVGYDNCIGYLKGGFNHWKNAGKPVDTIVSISAKELEKIASAKEVKIIDVRKPTEFLSERLEQAESFPLNEINKWLNKIDKNEPKYLHCAGGYRSMIATSILRKEGYQNIIDIEGGTNAIFNNTTLKKTAYVCPSTL